MEEIRDGDRSTCSYYASTIVRRRRNQIEMLQDPMGNWLTDDENIKAMVQNFFKNLYSNEGTPCTPYLLPHNYFPMLSCEEMPDLSRPFIESDIKKAIF